MSAKFRVAIMRLPVSVICLFFISFSSCSKQSTQSLSDSTNDQVIAFQPLDEFSVQDVNSMTQAISAFYNKRVIVLTPIAIPLTFLDPRIKKYNADSILTLLSKFQKDSIVEIIGFTNHPIFTIRKTKSQSYYDEKIFGIGYQPGNVSLVSDDRLKTFNRDIFKNRIKNVIIHEVGHNLGLGHCPDVQCIMSTEYGYFEKLDVSENKYCKKCGEKLHR